MVSSISFSEVPHLHSFGNRDLLNLPKTAFLCSRNIPASAVLKCYDWAIEQREAGRCIISGFHSKIEKDVLHYLLQGKQPLIIALARGLKENIEPVFTEALKENRLLFITPFERNIKRVTEQTAEKRNRMMTDLVDEVVVGFISKGGSLDKLISTVESSIKITKL